MSVENSECQDSSESPDITLTSSTEVAEDGPSVIRLIQSLQRGEVTGKSLSPTDRRKVVEHLNNEGCSVGEMAEVLKVSDRTILRDRKEIQASYALQNDQQTVAQMIGRLVQTAEVAVQRLRKIARDKSTPPAVAVDATHRTYQIVSDVTVRLQSLALLPSATHHIQATLTHHAGDVPGYEILDAEMKRVKSTVVEAAANNPQLLAQFEALEDRVKRGKLLNDIAAVEQDAQKGGIDAPAAD
jgi:hypothetical protein